MKPLHGFWLIFVALVTQAMFSLAGVPIHVFGFAVLAALLERLLQIHPLGVPLYVFVFAVFALAAITMAFSKSMELGQRAVLVLAALSLGFGPFQYLTNRIGINVPIPYAQVSTVRAIILGVLALAALVLGFAATKRRWHRFFIIVTVLTLSVFSWGGSQALIHLGGVTLFLVALATAIAFFGIFLYPAWKMGEEDAQRMREGKPPKHEWLFNPNNPHSPFKKK